MEFSKLPTETLFNIISYLDSTEIATLQVACKRLYFIGGNDIFWKTYPTNITDTSFLPKKLCKMLTEANLSAKEKMRRLYTDGRICSICNSRRTLGKVSDVVYKAFKGKWCNRCSRARLVVKSEAIKYLHKMGYKGTKAIDFLNGLTRAKVCLRGNTGLYYSKEEILNKMDN